MAAAKWASDACLDTMLTYIGTSTILFVISDASTPPTYSECATTYDLATHVMGGGDFSNGDGTSGRRVTVAEQATLTVDHTGTATGVALGISGTSTLVYVTTCTSQSLTAGNTVTVPAWTIQVGDPT